MGVKVRNYLLQAQLIVDKQANEKESRVFLVNGEVANRFALNLVTPAVNECPLVRVLPLAPVQFVP